ncbi:MAG: dioxygenase extradiol [Betaproteobacteria bacterium]|nr:dioxygenase extradiol [Betaproteobacteria bacterium]
MDTNISTTTRMPAIFFGHGSPMNAIKTSRYSEAWGRFGAGTPKPKAILMVSAHWYTRGTAVTAMQQPRTIHDFGGFPQALFDVEYPAPGSPALAARVTGLLKPVQVQPDNEWGLDHGTWGVLAHAYPQADVPVVQLSIDGTRPPQYHYDLARHLAPLRDEGVLIAASGNVVHNLRNLRRDGINAPYDWAENFERAVREHAQSGEHQALIDYESFGEAARLSVPTPEHYLPLLYVLAQQQKDDTMSFPTAGIDMGSISMLSVAIGA